MLINQTIQDFIAEVNSPSPAPGGGSVSALVGALGSSLVAMYTHLSINKKKFKEAPEEIQIQFQNQMNAMQETIRQFLVCVDKDTEVYNKVMGAYKLPKDSLEEQSIRNVAIKKATEDAINSPLSIMRYGVDLLKQLENMLPYGNKNAASDYAVGIILLDAAIQGAALNVKINLPSASEEVRTKSESEMNALLLATTEFKKKLLNEAMQYI